MNLSPVETFSRCEAVAMEVLTEAPRRAADAALYLAHVEGGAALRRLAGATERPLVSIHRSIRRVEALRDDPLLDYAIGALGRAARDALAEDILTETAMLSPTRQSTASRAARRTPPIERAAERALQRLSEPEAFLMVAHGAERAGVFCRKNKFRRPLGLTPVAAAAEFAARDWIRCVSKTAVSAKYEITPAGRAWLKRRRAEAEAQTAPRIAHAEGVHPFAAQHMKRGERLVARPDGRIETIQVNAGESPLGWLARRKGQDGEPFLTPDEVEAGERLRNDFEAAQMGPRVAQDWRSFLAPIDRRAGPSSPAQGPVGARDRVARALADLGPGLADAALRACCFLEGLEATERRMGWSARSGKVVLKLALQRLSAHYGLVRSDAAPAC